MLKRVKEYNKSTSHIKKTVKLNYLYRYYYDIIRFDIIIKNMKIYLHLHIKSILISTLLIFPVFIT
jgi:hypothetical protein